MDLDKIKKINTEMLIKLSLIIDKMEIKDELKSLNIDTGDKAQDDLELGKELILLVITKLYKAEEEIYELVAKYKNISIEEAKSEPIIPILAEILGIGEIKSFLS